MKSQQYGYVPSKSMIKINAAKLLLNNAGGTEKARQAGHSAQQALNNPDDFFS
ncbi:MAG: hypothetical protein WB445_07560 [Acinetobacter sp.]